jgi:hypothetical protein
MLRGGDGDADDVIVLGKVDAAYAGSGTSHGTDVALVEADSHAQVRGEEDNLAAVGDAGGDQFIVLVDADGDDATSHDVAEVLERGLLYRSIASGEEDELAHFFQVANR